MIFVARAGVVCWALIPVFLALLFIAGSGWAAFIALLTGGAILAWLVSYVRRRRREKQFEFGWFLIKESGIAVIITSIVGAFLFLSSAFVFLFPGFVNELGEQYAMTVAKILVVLFWLALTLTILSWVLVFYAESTVYLRLHKFRSSLSSFGYGSLCLVINVCVVFLFLGVINDNFLPLSNPTQYITLAFFAFLTICAGVIAGCFQETMK